MSIEGKALQAVVELGDVPAEAAAAYALGFVAGATPVESIEFFGRSFLACAVAQVVMIVRVYTPLGRQALWLGSCGRNELRVHITRTGAQPPVKRLPSRATPSRPPLTVRPPRRCCHLLLAAS